MLSGEKKKLVGTLSNFYMKSGIKFQTLFLHFFGPTLFSPAHLHLNNTLDLCTFFRGVFGYVPGAAHERFGVKYFSCPQLHLCPQKWFFVCRFGFVGSPGTPHLVFLIFWYFGGAHLRQLKTGQKNILRNFLKDFLKEISLRISLNKFP